MGVLKTEAKSPDPHRENPNDFDLNVSMPTTGESRDGGENVRNYDSDADEMNEQIHELDQDQENQNFPAATQPIIISISPNGHHSRSFSIDSDDNNVSHRQEPGGSRAARNKTNSEPVRRRDSTQGIYALLFKC
jgi:hypothetical protein